MKTIEYKGRIYPEFQTKGNASKYIFPIAKEVCIGNGLDIGCMKKEWSFPGSHPIDISFDDGWSAMNLPDGEYDYIFSSHCLEHLSDWVGALDYWTTKIKIGGVIFLYLPHYSQSYWRPWNNRKHISCFENNHIKEYFYESGYWKNIFVSEGYDLYNSFACMAEKI